MVKIMSIKVYSPFSINFSHFMFSSLPINKKIWGKNLPHYVIKLLFLKLCHTSAHLLYSQIYV